MTKLTETQYGTQVEGQPPVPRDNLGQARTHVRVERKRAEELGRHDYKIKVVTREVTATPWAEVPEDYTDTSEY